MKFILFILFSFGLFLQSFAQEDLLATLSAGDDSDPGYTGTTFKSTRVINSHSVETLYKGSLDFRISHRFGRINSGAYNFFGLDQSTIRLALEYGLTDHITVGIGRSSYQKIYDSFTKVKLARQRKSTSSWFPVSITWFSNITSTTIDRKDALMDGKVMYRYAFAHQLIVARKFSNKLSLQVAPILIHRNLAEENETNDSYAIEGGGKFSISKRVSVNADYIYRLNQQPDNVYYNSMSVGVDIETGGHVFQLHVTNSQGMIEQVFVPRTTGNLSKGDLFYGFNISRQFKLKKTK